MGASFEIPQTPDAHEKFSYNVLVKDIAGSSSPGHSSMGENYDGVPTSTDRNTSKAEEAHSASAIHSTTVREKNPSLLNPSDARRPSWVSTSEDGHPPPAYLVPSPALSQSQSTTKLFLPSHIIRFLEQNQSCMFVIISSVFGSVMALFTKLLELGGGGMHPFQILFMRMVVTTIGGTAYLWWKRVPNALLGQKGARGLLLFRGVSGFLGIFGIWTAIRKFP